MNENQADIVWWNAFKEGDREAFDNLFRRFYPFLFLYGCKICPDKEIVDDCIQDLFIELWQSRATTSVKSVKAYFFKALKYKIYRHFRQSQNMIAVNDTEENGFFEISHDHFIVHREEEKQTAQQIIQAINKLPGRQKEIVYLKIYQSLSYEEISEVMGINYQVARNLFYQAIKSLRQLLS